MARIVTGTSMIDGARQLADQQGATLRFPDAEILTYLNDGLAAWWDIIVSTRAWPWCGKTLLNIGTVTQTGADPTIVLAGEPIGDFSVLVEITTGGTQATAVYKWSINGGQTYTTGVTASASATILPNTGMAITFPAGTYTLGNVYSATVAPPTTVSTQQWYTLPADFYKIHSVLVTGPGWPGPVALDEMGRIEEAYWRDTGLAPGGSPMRYQIKNTGPSSYSAGFTSIGFFPVPNQATKYRISYYPTAPRLATSATTIDTFNGWGDEYAVYYAAIKMAMKDEDFELSDRLMPTLKEIEKRIRGVSTNRTADAPHIQNGNANRWLRRYRFWRS